MARRLKLIASLSSVALAGAMVASCGGEGEAGKTGEAGHAAHPPGGEAEGEGASGVAEGEAAAAAEAATDKPSYLAALVAVRGHIQAGLSLFIAGDQTLAAAHMRHPQAEVLTSLAPAFAAYGSNGIDGELEALAKAVESGESEIDVRAKFEAADRAIEAAAARSNPTVRDQLLGYAKALVAAGGEFDLAVDEGAIVNLHEYQDAYGFAQTVANGLSRIESASQDEEAAILLARAEAMRALAVAPSVERPTPPLASPSVIYGAAARIEIAARGLPADAPQ